MEQSRRCLENQTRHGRNRLCTRSSGGGNGINRYNAPGLGRKPDYASKNSTDGDLAAEQMLRSGPPRPIGTIGLLRVAAQILRFQLRLIGYIRSMPAADRIPLGDSTCQMPLGFFFLAVKTLRRKAADVNRSLAVNDIFGQQQTDRSIVTESARVQTCGDEQTGQLRHRTENGLAIRRKRKETDAFTLPLGLLKRRHKTGHPLSTIVAHVRRCRDF